MLKRFLFFFALCSLFACNNESGIDKSVDSTNNVIDSQKYITKDSLRIKADSNKKIIDSTYKVLKDSMKAVK